MWSLTEKAGGCRVVLPAGRDQHHPPQGEAFLVLTGEEEWEWGSFWRGWVCPHQTSGLGMVCSCGRQEECASNQPLPDQSQQGHAD